MKKFQVDKLEPKEDKKCMFIGHPKQLGIPPVSDPKAIRDCFLNRVLSRGNVSLERVEWEDGGDLMRLLNCLFN